MSAQWWRKHLNVHNCGKMNFVFDTLQPKWSGSGPLITRAVCIHSRLWKKQSKKTSMSTSKQLEGCWDCGLASGRETFQMYEFTCDSGAAGCYAAAISRDLVFPSGAFQRAWTTGTTKKGSVNTCHPELNNIRQITEGRVRNTRLINAFDDVRLTFMFYLEHLDSFASGFTANESHNTFHELHSQVWCYYGSGAECKTGSSQKNILNKHTLLLVKVNAQRIWLLQAALEPGKFFCVFLTICSHKCKMYTDGDDKLRQLYCPLLPEIQSDKVEKCNLEQS